MLAQKRSWQTVLAVIAVLIVETSSGTLAEAQTLLGRHGGGLLHRATCNCGRWTCPDCQARMFCPPSQVIQPDGSVAPTPMPAPTTGDGTRDPNATPSNVAPTAPTSPSPIDPSIAALSGSFAGRGQTSFGGSARTQNLDMIGDFLGVPNGISIIAIGYSVQTYYASPTSGGGFSFDTTGNSSTDFETDGAVTSNGSGAIGTLAAPLNPTDVDQPGSPGYSFLQGTASTSDMYLWNLDYQYGKAIVLPGSLIFGRMKMSENSSPVPTNRIFINYSMFNNVPLLTDRGVTVNRVSPGFETTLGSPDASFEFRAPFATTLDSNIQADGLTNTSNAEFGNLFFSLKRVLARGDRGLLTVGLSMLAPTADDTRVFIADGTEVLRINNRSVHLQPFIGGFHNLTQNLFTQWIFQVDVDANGNPILFREGGFSSNPLSTGSGPTYRVQDQALAYLDSSTGYWLYRNRGESRSTAVTGLAAVAEVHYNRSLNGPDCFVLPNGSIIQPAINEFEMINLVGGLTVEFNYRSRLTFGYASPLGNNADRAFDGEMRVTFNQLY